MLHVYGYLCKRPNPPSVSLVAALAGTTDEYTQSILSRYRGDHVEEEIQ